MLKVTQPKTQGWREKVAEWSDRVSDWVREFLPDLGEPVPVPVRPTPPRRPRGR